MPWMQAGFLGFCVCACVCTHVRVCVCLRVFVCVLVCLSVFLCVSFSLRLIFVVSSCINFLAFSHNFSYSQISHTYWVYLLCRPAEVSSNQNLSLIRWQSMQWKKLCDVQWLLLLTVVINSIEWKQFTPKITISASLISVFCECVWDICMRPYQKNNIKLKGLEACVQ
jgi:hypothetical protein